MIYPSTTGKADGKDLRLRTMESVWLQGKLKMWGRWATYSEMPEAVNMFKRMLSRGKVTRDDLVKAVHQLRKAGCSNDDLEQWMILMHEESAKSSLVFCTDSEGMKMEKVICETLCSHNGLKKIIQWRYLGKGRSKRSIARLVQEDNPRWSFRTCQNRVDQWLHLAEYVLYVPMSEAFELNHLRFSN
ncbi:DUF1133 family protein [Pantoea stewartii]|uniref:DUF1133 family protein n=1 Tax=Pantoea stewartii TaxID=66269 RepID=UPI000736CE61|nr:DUF1133 family protein [Pantoea stewartii]KTS27611.1 hypothetical protein NS381_09445 [Pantoea stewartii]